MKKYIYVTKFALTSGIRKVLAEPVDKWKYARGIANSMLFLRRSEFTFTPEEAIIKAEEMRIKRLQSLDKSAKRLGKLNFDLMVKKLDE